MEDRGQVSLEYILIFAISLILLIVFTIPLTQQSVEDVLDVSDAIDCKSGLAEIARCISQVYGEGQGSRHTADITCQKAVKVNVDENHVSARLKLADGTYKLVEADCKSNLARTSLNLHRGENMVVVEWPVGSEKMEIYTKFF